MRRAPGCDGEDKQEENKQQRLQRVARHLLAGKLDHPHHLALYAVWSVRVRVHESHNKECVVWCEEREREREKSEERYVSREND